MSETFEQVRLLAASGNVVVTDHASTRLHENRLKAIEVAEGVATAILVEDYPDWHRGPSILVLQYDRKSQPLHALWGLLADTSEPAFLVTVYRPDPQQWSPDFKVRR